MIDAICARTLRPFNVNLFVHAKAQADTAREERWVKALRPVFQRFKCRATCHVEDDLH